MQAASGNWVIDIQIVGEEPEAQSDRSDAPLCSLCALIGHAPRLLRTEVRWARTLHVRSTYLPVVYYDAFKSTDLTSCHEKLVGIQRVDYRDDNYETSRRRFLSLRYVSGITVTVGVIRTRV